MHPSNLLMFMGALGFVDRRAFWLHGCLAVGLNKIGQSYPMARLRRISTDALGRKDPDLPSF